MNRTPLRSCPRCQPRDGSCSIKNHGLSRTSVLFSLLCLSLVPGLLFSTFARPLPSLSFGNPSFVCRIAYLPLFCRRSPSTPISGVLTTQTPLGPASGLVGESGVVRYSVRYGSASRWGPSSVSTLWTPPNGPANATALPLACPQPFLDDSQFEEDCLSMILYVPPKVRTTTGLSTLMWIHGGSFIVGSATGPGLDGSRLALATDSIVAVIQYRLGALGFMSPDGTTNLALKDVITALNFLQTVVPSFGGKASKITVAGQSSGATMIRALLAVPSAAQLFQSASLHSDPMDFGFLKPSTQELLQSNFNSLISCDATQPSCQDSLSLDTIITAQMNLFQNANTIDPSTGQAEPIRPVNDGSLITSTLDSSSPFPRVSKPLLISTVLDEAGPAIFSAFPDPLPEGEFPAIVNATLGPERTKTVLASSFYPASSDGDARHQLEVLGTDYIFKCSSWAFARSWARNGGMAYAGLYSLGENYPDNAGIPFCTQPGNVCHEGDIEIVFGTVPNPTPAQAALTTQVQAYYKAFLSTGNPNAHGVPVWKPATTTNVHAILLGGTGEAPVGACQPNFWGEQVKFDFQVFLI